MKKAVAVILSLLLLLSTAVIPAGAKAEGTFKKLSLKKVPSFITERQLSDDELPGWDSAGLDELRQKISTFGDFAAWVRVALVPGKNYYSQTTSNENGQFTFGASFAWSWMEYHFSPNGTASVAQYCLEDDYPGIRTVCVFLKNGSSVDMKCAVCIPMDEGYYLINPELFAEMNRQQIQGSCAMEDILLVSDLTGLLSYFKQKKSQVTQILTLDSVGNVVLDPGDFVYIPDNPDLVTTVYVDETAKYPPKNARPNLSGCGFPGQLSTRSAIGRETALVLEKGTYEEAAAVITTLPDVLNYLFYTGYTQSGFDECVEMHDGEWHFNLKPSVVFRRGKGNCGGTAGLVAGLLEGDYGEVGMITLRFPEDGHVINYIRDQNLYYVFDCVSWVGSGHQGYGLSFCWGKTLTEAAMKYAKKQNTRQMAAYTNPCGGDIPMIFSGNASILPGNYCDDLTILQETPEEGYTYTLTEVDPAILQAIDTIRGVW